MSRFSAILSAIRRAASCYRQSGATPRIASVLLCLVSVAAAATGVAAGPRGASLESSSRRFGQLDDGREVTLYDLEHTGGLEVELMTYGATITRVRFPDRHGKPGDLMLRLDSLTDYLKGHPLFGSLVGRYANRIAGARFSIDGQEYHLEANAGANHIHGGRQGFQKQLWSARAFRKDDRVGVRLTHRSADGTAGYPGNLDVTVTYAVTERDELVMDYRATTDKPTHINLTNHAYWNVDSGGRENVLGHSLTIHADRILEATRDRFPTGEIRSVSGTPYDFRQAHTVGERVHQTQIDNYDDCYVVRRSEADALAPAARVFGPRSGRLMEVFTTQPGVQLYTAKGLHREAAEGVNYGPYAGLCLETQHFPDTPNQATFPSTLLRPGQTYHETTVFRFSILE